MSDPLGIGRTERQVVDLARANQCYGACIHALGEAWAAEHREKYGPQMPNPSPQAIWKRAHDVLEAHHAALLEGVWDVLQTVHDWRGLCDSDETETFERIAEMFHRETGFLRPGKDCRQHDPGQRRTAWDAWVDRKNSEVDAKIRATLALLAQEVE